MCSPISALVCCSPRRLSLSIHAGSSPKNPSGRRRRSLRSLSPSARPFARERNPAPWRDCLNRPLEKARQEGQIAPYPRQCNRAANCARQCNRAFCYRSATAALASLRTSLRDHGFKSHSIGENGVRNRSARCDQDFDTGPVCFHQRCKIDTVNRAKGVSTRSDVARRGFCALRPASKTNRLKNISIEMWSPPQTCAALMSYIKRLEIPYMAGSTLAV